MKEELGLDHFEGRSWTGLHRHALMTCIAYAYLQHLRLSEHRRTERGKNDGPLAGSATVTQPARRAAVHHRDDFLPALIPPRPMSPLPEPLQAAVRPQSAQVVLIALPRARVLPVCTGAGVHLVQAQRGDGAASVPSLRGVLRPTSFDLPGRRDRGWRYILRLVCRSCGGVLSFGWHASTEGSSSDHCASLSIIPSRLGEWKTPAPPARSGDSRP